MRSVEVRSVEKRARRRWTRYTSASALLMVVACGGDTEPTDEVTVPPEVSSTPDQGFAALESALRNDDSTVRLSFDVTAEGAVGASLVGTLVLGIEGEARLEAAGQFAGQSVDVVLISDGERMFWTGAANGVDTPPDLRDALAVGFTRMGILHNLARLTGGAPPDHADGGVTEWVVVSATDERGMLEGAPAVAASSSAFRAITVAGQPSGTFALEFDGPTPRARRQMVEFPQGIMRVTERYGAVEFGGEIAAGTFDTTPLDIGR